ncbi:MAG: hypothetical protein Roseis3KO_01680 [Roseivirga sp.]
MEFNIEEKREGKLDREKLASILTEVRKQGYVVLKNVFSRTKIEQLNANLTRDYSDYFESKDHEDALKVGSKRFVVTIDVKDDFNAPEIYCNPLILEILSHLLEPDFVISDLTCVLSLPGSKKMRAHRDGAIYYNSPVRTLLPPFAIGLLIPLVSFNEFNGTTRLWPGSHFGKTTVQEVAQSPDFIDVNIDSGSCILMDHRLCHSGNPNYSQTVRPLLYCNYCNPWYLDNGNFKKQAYFYLSDEELIKIPERHRKIFVRRNIDLSSTYKILNQVGGKIEKE